MSIYPKSELGGPLYQRVDGCCSDCGAATPANIGAVTLEDHHQGWVLCVDRRLRCEGCFLAYDAARRLEGDGLVNTLSKELHATLTRNLQGTIAPSVAVLKASIVDAINRQFDREDGASLVTGVELKPDGHLSVQIQLPVDWSTMAVGHVQVTVDPALWPANSDPEGQ